MRRDRLGVVPDVIGVLDDEAGVARDLVALQTTNQFRRLAGKHRPEDDLKRPSTVNFYTRPEIYCPYRVLTAQLISS